MEYLLNDISNNNISDNVSDTIFNNITPFLI